MLQGLLGWQREYKYTLLKRLQRPARQAGWRVVKFTTLEMESLAGSVAGASQGEKEPPDPGGGGRVQCFGSWTGSRKVFDQVRLWGSKNFDEKHIGTFMQYCFAFSEDLKEEDELVLWMCQLVTKYLEEHGGWSCWDQTVGSWDWSTLALSHQWAIPPPAWARKRELADIELEDRLKEDSVKEDVTKEENVMKEESVMKEKSVMKEESVKKEEGVKKDDSVIKEKDLMKDSVMKEEESMMKDEDIASPILASFWGSRLPPPVPSSPASPWRPWVQEEVKVKEETLPRKPWQRKKRRSPAAAARSRHRLLIWKEKMDSLGKSRLPLEQRTTPHRPVREMVGTRLLGRLEMQSDTVCGGGEGLKLDLPRWMPVENGMGEARVPLGVEGGKTAIASGSNTISSLQLSTPPLSPWSSSAALPPSPFGWPGSAMLPPPPSGYMCGMLPGVVTACPSCRAWGLLTSP